MGYGSRANKGCGCICHNKHIGRCEGAYGRRDEQCFQSEAALAILILAHGDWTGSNVASHITRMDPAAGLNHGHAPKLYTNFVMEVHTTLETVQVTVADDVAIYRWIYCSLCKRY